MRVGAKMLQAASRVARRNLEHSSRSPSNERGNNNAAAVRCRSGRWFRSLKAHRDDRLDFTGCMNVTKADKPLAFRFSWSVLTSKWRSMGPFVWTNEIELGESSHLCRPPFPYRSDTLQYNSIHDSI